MAGAKQWRVPCPCLEEQDSRMCMASEVSDANIGYFPSDAEHRVHSDLDESDLQEYLNETHRRGEVLVACNDCRALLRIVDGVEVVYRGEPRHDSHVVAGGEA